MQALQHSLQEERAKAAARAEAAGAAQEKALARKMEDKAYADAAAMLTRLADAALTTRIAELTAEDIAALSGERRDAVRRAAEGLQQGEKLEIAAAHKMSEPVKRSLVKAIEKAAGDTKLACQFTVSPELIAGVRIALGERVLHANLADELQFFHREGGHG